MHFTLERLFWFLKLASIIGIVIVYHMKSFNKEELRKHKLAIGYILGMLIAMLFMP